MNFISSLNALSASSGGFNWYGFLIGSGMVICIVLAYLTSKKKGFYSDFVFDLAICCIPLAIVGARLGYIIFDLTGPNPSTWTFKKIIGLEGGGLAGLQIYGGLVAAALGSLIVLALQKKHPENERVSWLQMADLGFTFIILGQIIGRWGNFANQEAYGNPVTNPSLQWFPYAVYIEAQSGWYQATFFYESFWNLIGWGFMLWFYLGKRQSYDGFNFSFYCIWYGFGRFFIEGLRSDSLYIGDTLRVSQLVSIILFFFGIGMNIYHIVRARKANKNPFILIPKTELSLDYYGYEKTMAYRLSLAPQAEPAKKGKEEPKFDTPDDSDKYWEVTENNPAPEGEATETIAAGNHKIASDPTNDPEKITPAENVGNPEKETKND